MTAKLAHFVGRVEAALGDGADEATVLAAVRSAMSELVADDDWLPEAAAQPHPVHYQQFLLHKDPAARFSVVSFVWGPGQKTPIHDHTVWGVIGMLRGSELSQGFAKSADGMTPEGQIERLQPGDVVAVSPAIGDIHQVCNAFDDKVSISIHAYGADIGQVRRHVFDPVTGVAKEFVSGYSGVAAGARP
ncbi:cysteine dioxygenase [Variovorax sp. KK3]|uniref:cysteine dioxygenase family protein n=1 Tax=Variovorax sp. KK3 TaxID=1855728 RepID=UPI00097C5F69|nr:cysteine dioxygenase [Variovorax sp. KK3]